MLNRLSKNLKSALGVQDIQLDPGFLTKTGRIQLMYGAWVNTVQLGIGMVLGFGSVAIPQLLSPESDVQITRVEASWIVSVVPLLVPVGCFISGFVMDWAGRRIMLIYCQIPMFGGWLYTALSRTPNDIIIARAITGVGCGMAMAPSRAYGTEISLPNMRGVIGAFPSLAVSLGISLTAGLDKFFSWQFLCLICCGFTLVNFCSFMFLPETPYFLLQTKTEAQALENLVLFRGEDYNVEREMEDLKDFKERNDLRKLTWMGTIRMLFTSTSVKPFMIVMVYSAIAQASGISCILFWTIDLLQKAKSSFDVQIGNMLVGMTRAVMGAITSALLYRYGRKPLAFISAFGVAIVCGSLAGVLMSSNTPSLAPQICFMFYVVFASLGYYTLPLLVAFELYPLQIRGILGGVTISMTHFMTFASTKTEPLFLDLLGIANTFISFGVISLIGCVYIYFWFPETKDLTLQEIEEFYKEIRPKLVSQRRLQSLSQLSKIHLTAGRSSTFSLDILNRRSTLDKLDQQKRIEELLRINKQLRNLSTSGSEIKRTKSLKSKKSHVEFDDTSTDSLKIIYQEKKDWNKRHKKKNGRLPPKEDTNRAEEKDESSPAVRGKKGEKKKVKNSVKIEDGKKREEDTLKVEDRLKETQQDLEEETSMHKKDEKNKDEETPKDEDQASTSKKNT